MTTESSPAASLSHKIHIPDDILLEILKILPLRSIFKFKFVSKRWFSILSDPYFFINYHLSKNLFSEFTILGGDIFPVGSNLNSFKYDLTDNINNNRSSYCSVLTLPERLHDRTECWQQNYRILESSNGLLLCASQRFSFGSYPSSYESGRTYYICNPVTDEWITLPPPLLKCANNFERAGFIAQLDPSLKVSSFRVVILQKLDLSRIAEFEVFCSETGIWSVNLVQLSEEIGVVLGINSLKGHVTTSDGIFHLFNKKRFTRILVYNLNYPNLCRQIWFPENGAVQKNSIRYYKYADAFNGKLRYMEVFDKGSGPHLGIWTLKDYEDNGHWNLDEIILLCDSRFYERDNYHIFGPIYGDNILYVLFCSDGVLKAYHIHKRQAMEMGVVVAPTPEFWLSHSPGVKETFWSNTGFHSWGNAMPYMLPGQQATMQHR